LPSPQLGVTSEITAADGAPNGPHAVGESLVALHEKRSAIVARKIALFTALL